MWFCAGKWILRSHLDRLGSDVNPGEKIQMKIVLGGVWGGVCLSIQTVVSFQKGKSLSQVSKIPCYEWFSF